MSCDVVCFLVATVSERKELFMNMGPRLRIICKASLVGAQVYADTPENARKFLQEQVCEAIGIKVLPKPPENEIRTTRLHLIKMLVDLGGKELQEAKTLVEDYIGRNQWSFKQGDKLPE
jgi:hypothetical protein